MHEQVVASDEANVTVEQSSQYDDLRSIETVENTTEELENLPVEEGVTTPQSEESEMDALVMQVVQALRQIHQAGDTFAAIVCATAYSTRPRYR